MIRPLILLALAVSVSSTQFQLRADEAIVPAGAKLEKLFEAVMLTEGVTVAPDGMVYFSDITFSHQAVTDNGAIHAGHIWKFISRNTNTLQYRIGSKISAKGLMIGGFNFFI